MQAERDRVPQSAATAFAHDMSPVEAGPLALWRGEHRAEVYGRTVPLSRREFDLLTELVGAAGHLVQRARLYEVVWGRAYHHGHRDVDAYVRKLRRKLHAAAPGWEFIHTHRQIGYRLSPEREDTMSASTIGFARLPKAVRDLLDDAAAAATSAAGALETLARDPTRDTALAQIVDLERDDDRITHELQHALTVARLGKDERGELLHTIQAIDDVLDAIDDAARDLPRANEALQHEPLQRASSVIRDLVRTSMAAVARIEEPAAARETLHQRAHELDRELRIELRTMQALIADTNDALAVVRAAGLLRRLRSIGQACTRALLAVEVLAATHA